MTMTVDELQTRMTAVNTRLAIARDAEKWAAVAELEAERAALVRQLDAAKQAADAAERAAMLQREAQHVADLTAQGEALQGRWLAWLTALDAAERAARQLWNEYGAIIGAAAALQRDYGKATGGATLALTIGSLTGAALVVKREAGALRWRPKLGVIDD